jgi:heme/copper-type cytochrome/quinol oxidase subunit 4
MIQQQTVLEKNLHSHYLGILLVIIFTNTPTYNVINNQISNNVN